MPASESLLAPGEDIRNRRRSSSLLGRLKKETIEDENDQVASSNLNANWVHYKGAWTIHIVIIIVLLLLYDGLPFISSEMSWTLTNITYVIGSTIMFHLVTGVPFEFNAGAYDTLTMWEQIDDGDQYTPTKKFLLGVPIGLFLVSTHFTHYDLSMFMINFFFCIVSVVPKLPSSHRLRLIIDNDLATVAQEASQRRVPHRRIPVHDLKNQS